jgi:hypothetical protein
MNEREKEESKAQIRTILSEGLEELTNFLKFELENELRHIRGLIIDGKIVLADERLQALQEKLHQKFPFRYGSEMDAKGYSDLKVLFREV